MLGTRGQWAAWDPQPRLGMAELGCEPDRVPSLSSSLGKKGYFGPEHF
jgi:hypothetical protein